MKTSFKLTNICVRINRPVIMRVVHTVDPILKYAKKTLPLTAPLDVASMTFLIFLVPSLSSSIAMLPDSDVRDWK